MKLNKRRIAVLGCMTSLISDSTFAGRAPINNPNLYEKDGWWRDLTDPKNKRNKNGNSSFRSKKAKCKRR